MRRGSIVATSHDMPLVCYPSSILSFGLSTSRATALPLATPYSDHTPLLSTRAARLLYAITKTAVQSNSQISSGLSRCVTSLVDLTTSSRVAYDSHREHLPMLTHRFHRAEHGKSQLPIATSSFAVRHRLTSRFPASAHAPFMVELFAAECLTLGPRSCRRTPAARNCLRAVSPRR